jgi:hypothetical protein
MIFNFQEYKLLDFCFRAGCVDIFLLIISNQVNQVWLWLCWLKDMRDKNRVFEDVFFLIGENRLWRENAKITKIV